MTFMTAPPSAAGRTSASWKANTGNARRVVSWAVDDSARFFSSRPIAARILLEGNRAISNTQNFTCESAYFGVFR